MDSFGGAADVEADPFGYRPSEWNLRALQAPQDPQRP
jgi:hypothetical protein